MIYLSSYRMGHNADVLAAREVGARAGMVFNALDVYGETRLRNQDREAADLARLGYTSEEIDLRGYFDNPEGLAARLATLDLLWVVGGNAFVLAKAMNASGFGSALIPALRQGLIYAGYSAGSCVAGPDLRGIDLMDDPDHIPDGYDAGMAPATLGLVPFRIVPHWRSDHPEAASAERAVAYLDAEGLEYRALRDGEALVHGDTGEARP